MWGVALVKAWGGWVDSFSFSAFTFSLDLISSGFIIVALLLLCQAPSFIGKVKDPHKTDLRRLSLGRLCTRIAKFFLQLAREFGIDDHWLTIPADGVATVSDLNPSWYRAKNAFYVPPRVGDGFGYFSIFCPCCYRPGSLRVPVATENDYDATKKKGVQLCLPLSHEKIGDFWRRRDEGANGAHGCAKEQNQDVNATTARSSRPSDVDLRQVLEAGLVHVPKDKLKEIILHQEAMAKSSGVEAAGAWLAGRRWSSMPNESGGGSSSSTPDSCSDTDSAETELPDRSWLTSYTAEEWANFLCLERTHIVSAYLKEDLERWRSGVPVEWIDLAWFGEKALQREKSSRKLSVDNSEMESDSTEYPLSSPVSSPGTTERSSSLPVVSPPTSNTEDLSQMDPGSTVDVGNGAQELDAGDSGNGGGGISDLTTTQKTFAKSSEEELEGGRKIYCDSGKEKKRSSVIDLFLRRFDYDEAYRPSDIDLEGQKSWEEDWEKDNQSWEDWDREVHVAPSSDVGVAGNHVASRSDVVGSSSPNYEKKRFPDYEYSPLAALYDDPTDPYWLEPTTDDCDESSTHNSSSSKSSAKDSNSSSRESAERSHDQHSCRTSSKILDQDQNKIAEPETKKCAYIICLWGSSMEYLLGALVLGKSLKNTGTLHDLVCLHTDDVCESNLILLRKFWSTRCVRHVRASPRFYGGAEWQEQSRFQHVFTKLHVLNQTDYHKVLCLDIDMVVKDNIDSLFDLRAPAALRRGSNQGSAQVHGSTITGERFFRGHEDGDYDSEESYSWHQGNGINAGVMLFEPCRRDFLELATVAASTNHPEHINAGGPEQDFLSRAFADRPWTHIGVMFNFQVHQIFHNLNPLVSAERKTYLLPENQSQVRVIHFSGALKPWHHVLQENWRDWRFADFLSLDEGGSPSSSSPSQDRASRPEPQKSIDAFVQGTLDGFDTYQKWYLRKGYFTEDDAKEYGVALEEAQPDESSTARKDEKNSTASLHPLINTADGSRIDMKALDWYCERGIQVVRDSHVFWLDVFSQVYAQDLSVEERVALLIDRREKDGAKNDDEVVDDEEEQERKKELELDGAEDLQHEGNDENQISST